MTLTYDNNWTEELKVETKRNINIPITIIDI
jgi:hypothetical protein